MPSKELWLVQENHATVRLDLSVASRGMKTYSESRIELQNLQILKKILDKSSQFLASEQPCDPKSLEVALNIAGVEQIRSGNLETCGCGQPGGHSIGVMNERSVTDRGNVSSVVGDSQISLKYCRRHLLASIQLAVSDSELYFDRCCALKRTGTFATESKVNVFILTDFKKWCFDVSFLTSISV